jgi:hypothetical protein
MTDSYLPPTGLAQARARLSGLAADVESAKVITTDVDLWRRTQPELEALSQQLKPGQVLLFLEPTAELGWRRVLHRYGRAFIQLALRHNFEADVPARLRAAGLTVTTTIRFSTGPLGWRSYVLGRAEHIVARPDGSEARPR